VRFSTADAAGAAALRLRPGVEACEEGGAVWLRGPSLDAGLERALRLLPGAERFHVETDGRARPAGRRVPSAALPATGWVSAAAWSIPSSPPAAPGASAVARVALRVVRGGPERPARVLRLPLPALAGWAGSAPTVRLRPLLFAASETEAVLRGEPLPPIPGRRFAESDGLAVPCGFTLAPAVDGPTLRARLGLEGGDLALFDEYGAWERIPSAAWRHASRSAIRETAGGR
jgi:hypothetical protein